MASVRQKGFIEDLDFLREYNNSKDLFGYTEHAKRLYSYLNSLPKEASIIIALVGPYGIGKSFLLDLIHQNSFKEEKGKNYWFNFEAWRYDNRKDLWRAFIAELEEDIIDVIYDKNSQKLSERLRRWWDGVDYKSIAILFCSAFILAVFALWIFGKASFIEAFTAAIAFFALLLTVLNTYLRNPLKRQKSHEKALLRAVEILQARGYQRLYVVSEDVDRSADSGLLFIETLSLFLRRFDTKGLDNLSIKFIVPISNQSFNKEHQRASFMKAIDYFYYFNVQQLDIKGFVSKVFDKDFAGNLMQGYVDKLFNFLFVSETNPLNLRTWKMILRGANYRYIYLKGAKQFNVQPIICITVEMMKYYRVNIGKKDETTLFDQALARKSINHHELIRVLVCNHKQLDINDNSNLKYLNGVSEIQISGEQALIKKEESGFQIPPTISPGKSLSLARCYFDDFPESQR